jgi:hypothetical protein
VCDVTSGNVPSKDYYALAQDLYVPRGTIQFNIRLKFGCFKG